jgi:hypothetical protein
MKHQHLFVFGILVLAALAFSGCGSLGSNPPANPTPTPPFPTAVVVATVPAGDTPAAMEGKAAIGGDVFNDSNGDGKRDDNEPIIAGVIVQIGAGACPAGVLAVTTSTVNQPSYKFENLDSGDFCISIDAASAQNAAILGAGEWTVPQKAQGTITDNVKLRRADKLNVDFGWTFGVLGQTTPPPEQPTAPAGEPTQVAGEPTAVPIIPTPTAFVQPTAAPQPCVFKAAYVEDVTVPDGQLMLPNTQFIKTWRVQNTGTCSWGPGSGLQNLQFVGGNPLGAPNLVPIPNAIPAGATADLSIQMTAPAQPGSYKSNWKLRADDGTLIGVGPSNVALYASIRVQAAPPPTVVPPPTSVSPTTQPPPGPVQPIQFAPGATEAAVQGQVPANGIASYSVNAQAGQSMELTLSSNSPSARLAVLSPTGVPLAPQRGNPEGTYWQSTLTASGDYIIQVLAGSAAPVANFGLNVTIPVRITFAPGGTSAEVQGTTSESRVVTYLLKAMGGQTMTVNLTAPPNSAGITIYGMQDGQPLVRSQSGATSWTGQLPMTQDYVIQVVPFGNGTVNYTLNVTVQ